MVKKLYKIKDFLINYHKKLKLYKLNKYNYYYYNLILSLYNNTMSKYKIIKNTNNYVYNITIENNILYKINISNINFIYYININNIILLPINYTLKINIWYYILYNKYITYLSRYLYNLFLKINYINIKYPLLLLLIRSKFDNRLNKIKDFNKNKYSYKLFKNKYKIIYKNKKLVNLIVNNNKIKYIIKNRLLKFYILLSNYDLFRNIKYMWLKSSKIDLLYNNYSNIICNINLNEINKFNILGLYSLYWQILRYGFNYEYYFYNTNIYNIINNNNNIIIYNIIIYNIILLKKNILIIWYKIKNLIILNYINKKFYKYNKKFKLNKYNKHIYRKYLIKILSNYIFKFKPIKINNTKNYLLLVKNNLDYICNTYLFNIKYNKYYKYNLSILYIIDNILIDHKINNNINIFKNIFINIFKKLIGKYLFINWINILNNISNFNQKLKLIKKKNVIINFNNYFFIRNKSYINYIRLYKLYNLNYLWLFEKSIIYNIYIYYINLYYKIYILIIYNKSVIEKKK